MCSDANLLEVRGQIDGYIGSPFDQQLQRESIVGISDFGVLPPMWT